LIVVPVPTVSENHKFADHIIIRSSIMVYFMPEIWEVWWQTDGQIDGRTDRHSTMHNTTIYEESRIITLTQRWRCPIYTYIYYLYANLYANYANYVVLLSVANAYLSATGPPAYKCLRQWAATALLGTADHGCPRCLLPRDKLHYREMYASGGGLLVASTTLVYQRLIQLSSSTWSRKVM